MEARAYDDWDKSEVIAGRVVMMSPRPTFWHNMIAFQISRILADYFDAKGCDGGGGGAKRCVVIPDGTALYLEDEKHELVPDVMVVCDLSKIKPQGVYGTPDLVVEVLSPSSGKTDKVIKKKIYERHGVKEYWIVDQRSKSIEVYLLRDGRLELDDVYSIEDASTIESMTPEERAELVTEFKCGLFGDLIIKLSDVFKNLI